MQQTSVTNIYSLPTVPNICNQILREVISLARLSMAHVIMNEGNVSLLHQHRRMTETYFIIDGTGILYCGEDELYVTKGAYLVIPPQMPHKLKNTGDRPLEHLVFALPPFNSKDLELLDDDRTTGRKQTYFRNINPPVTALDGATIYELLSEEEREKLDFALAFGSLPTGRQAVLHYHKISEELYIGVNGSGTLKIGNNTYSMKRGAIAHIPQGVVHALDNEDGSETLEILCVSSPRYRDGDFIKL